MRFILCMWSCFDLIYFSAEIILNYITWIIINLNDSLFNQIHLSLNNSLFSHYVLLPINLYLLKLIHMEDN